MIAYAYAHFRNLITGLVLTAFLAVMAPGITHACGQIQQGLQDIQAHAGGEGALL
jgi:hypothetical protein